MLARTLTVVLLLGTALAALAPAAEAQKPGAGDPTGAAAAPAPAASSATPARAPAASPPVAAPAPAASSAPAAATPAEAPPAPPERRSRGSGVARVLLELLTSGATLFVSVPASLPFLAGLLAFDARVSTGRALGLSFATALVVSATASGGVLLIGNAAFGEDGSFLDGLIGGMVSYLITVPFATALFDRSGSVVSVLLTGAIILAPLGAVIGYEAGLANREMDEEEAALRQTATTSGPRRARAVSLRPWALPEQNGGLAGGLLLSGTL